MTTSLTPLDVVADIVARASPLWDRAGDANLTQPLVASRVSGALDDWRNLVAAGDHERFAQRLDWDGLTPDTAAALIGGASAADADAPWADALREAYGVTTDSVQAAFDNADPGRVLDPSDPLPFEELFVPLVEYARRRLAAAAPVAILGPAVQRSLERTLLARLTRLGLRALYSSFSVSRAVAQDAGILALAGALQEPATRILYDAFLAKLQRGRILAFFRDYSVLARLYGTTTALWIDATTEFVGRLADDLPAIGATFGGNEPLGGVAEVQGGLSDAHEGGRSVLIIRFGSGVRVVYKPRPLDVEQHFGEMLDWLGTRASTRLRHPAVLCRPTHGWLEFIETGPCQDRDAVARYYRRCGMLLAMTYALNGTDFHYENLLASGEDPVLIDLEMLLSHHFELVEELPAQELGAVDVARHAFERSVLKVALLPILKVGNQGEAFDMGGIGGAADTGVDLVVVRLASVNTDGMRQVKRAMRIEAQGRNLPVLDGAPVDALGFVDDIVCGFADVYRILMRDRETVLAPGGPLDHMRHARIRFIFRHTSLYASLLERVLHPNYLRDGVARSVQLDILTRPLLGLDAPPALWPLVAAERAALEQLDIPYFATSADDRTLTLPTGVVIPNCFQHSPHEEATKRLQTLDEADLAAQIDLIRASFAASAARDVRRTEAIVISADSRGNASANALSDDGALRGDVLDEASRLVEMIRARGIPTPDGARTWIASAYVPRARRYRVAPMSSSVFDGYGGLAIFFAELSRHIDAGLADEAVKLLQPLRSGATDIERFLRFHARADIGVGAGLTSGIYALVRAANAIGEPALLRDASAIARLMTDEVIARDESYGVMAGAAGAILSLLALADASGEDAALQCALRCADHLLTRRVIDAQTKWRVWLTRHGQPETGFAHGLAGIAYALQRLGRRVGDSHYLEAAAEAIAHERFVIRAAGDAADADERSSSWGRGRTGIALARLAGGVALDTDTLAESVASVAAARGNLVADSDDLCCGSAGRWELLLTASDALSKPELVADARDGVRQVVRRLRNDGAYRTASELGSSEIGLFRGAPGTIYQMLRVLDPATVPSLLTWH